MNKEDIIAMAKEAGLDPDLWNYTDAFERFAALVASAERYECAKVCESIDMEAFGVLPVRTVMITNHCAEAIRARNNQ